MLFAGNPLKGLSRLSILVSFATAPVLAGFSETTRNSESIQLQIQSLEKELAELPKESLNLTPWTLGYLSKDFDQPEVEISIETNFGSAFSIDLIALMPAIYTEDGEQLEPFCFPTRFTIERLTDSGEYELLFDFRDQDYIIEGIEPQLFQVEEVKATTGLRLNIFKLSENRTWVTGEYRAALAEMMAFAGPNNVALNHRVKTNSAEFDSYIWTPDALTDGFSLHSNVDRNPKNPNRVPLRMRGIERTVMDFDLGSRRTIDEFRFWPLAHTIQFNYTSSSGIGFPRGIKIIASRDRLFERSETLIDQTEIYPRTGSNPLMLRVQPTRARYVRIEMQNIVPDYRFGINELTIDEIEIFSAGRLISGGIIPKLIGMQETSYAVHAVTDGITAEGKILRLRRWVEDFTERKRIERILSSLRRELLVAREVEKERASYLTLAAIGFIIFLLLLFWLGYLMLERRWANIRENIACDIHDHLGANMMSVAHSLQLLEHSQEKVSSKQAELYKGAIQTARQSAQDARQIVHFLEHENSGHSWVEQVRDTATLIVGEINLEFDFKETKRFNQMSPTRQWDMMLFIKEALNNTSKHSQADSAKISLLSMPGELNILIEDNGVGIPAHRLPLKHLEMRARRLSAVFELDTAPEDGVRIRLKL
ncbi:MAG: histidine kinase [Verrucomicrobiota bacterium]